MLHKPYQELEQELFPVPASRALGDRDIYSSNIVIQVSAWDIQMRYLKEFPCWGQLGWIQFPRSQERDGWLSRPPCHHKCLHQPRLAVTESHSWSPHVLRRFSVLCSCSILWQDPPAQERIITPHPKPRTAQKAHYYLSK